MMTGVWLLKDRMRAMDLRQWTGMLICGVTLPTGLWAQVTASCHVMEMKDQIAPSDLPRAVRLDGIGNSHLEITATPEAQMWFDQGLNLLHDFWDYEAARAFEQGVR